MPYAVNVGENTAVALGRRGDMSLSDLANYGD